LLVLDNLGLDHQITTTNPLRGQPRFGVTTMKKNIKHLITGTLAGAALAAVPALGLAAPAFADVTAPSHAGVTHVVAHPHQLGASNAGGLMQPTLGNTNTNTAPQLGASNAGGLMQATNTNTNTAPQSGASNAGGLMQRTLANTNTAPQLGTGKSSRSKDDGGAIVQRR